MQYDFIEIGTSDMETLIEVCSNDAVGLSIEPIQEYLNMLPDKPNVKKLCMAIGEMDREAAIYFVHPDIIVKEDLPYFWRGCGSIDMVHPANTTSTFVEHRLIYMMSWPTLIKTYEIESVEYIKIDTEGYDCMIVNDLLATFLRPRRLSFECNNLTSYSVISATLDYVRSVGYVAIPNPKGFDDGDQHFIFEGVS